VLAEERRNGAVPPAAALPPQRAVPLTDSDDSDDSDHSGASTSTSSVTVLPTQTRGPSTRSYKAVLGLAAAAVVVVGGGAVALQGLGGSTSSSTAGSSALALADATSVRQSGTAYRSADLASAGGVLPSPSTPLATPEVATGSPDPGTATDRSGALLTSQTVTACVANLTQRTGVLAIVIDQGTYNGRPANVVVLPSEDDPKTLDVWVIGPGCTADSVDLYEWRRIPAS
jgi:hypothetical protein